MVREQSELLPPQEPFELPEAVQEQIRQKRKQTPEQRAALVQAQRARPAGDVAPFTARERQYLRKGLQASPQSQKAK